MEYGTAFSRQITVKPTSYFHVAKVALLHVIYISLKSTMCSIPCLMNIKVKLGF